MPPLRSFVRSLPLLIAGSSLACQGDDLVEPPIGTLEITTSTTGSEPDPDGYTVQVDAEEVLSIGPPGMVRTSNVVGDHTVRLHGVAANCAVAGENPRRVTITAGDTVSVSFSVTCSATTGGETTGSLQVSASTSGPSPDANGYTVIVDGTERGRLGPSGKLGVSGLAPGQHVVGLGSVAANCHVEGENPLVVSVAPGGSPLVPFVVTCIPGSQQSGSLHITVATSGGDQDPDGYTLSVDGSDKQSIGRAGDAIISNVAVGGHSVLLGGVAQGCGVYGFNPRAAFVISAGATVPLSFVITCPATVGSLVINTQTGGLNLDADGYSVTVDDGAAQSMGPNARVEFGAAAGIHALRLVGVSGNCKVEGENPRSATTSDGSMTDLNFNVTCSSAAAPGYQAIFLTTSDGMATAINDATQVVGNAQYGFLWQNGTLTDLVSACSPSQGDCDSWVYSINTAGQVVGTTQSFDLGASLWEGGVMTSLGDVGARHSVARAINDAGQVVGDLVYGGAYDQKSAFLWQNGVMTDLETRGEGEFWLEARDINNRGQVAGSRGGSREGDEGVPLHAIIWQEGTVTDLGTCGGIASRATGINASGHVVGFVWTAVGARHAFLWKEGVMTDLGTLGGDESEATAINDAGQVVGSSSTSAGTTHAFLWEDGVMFDLGTLGGDISYALDINSAGQVVGGTAEASGEGIRPTIWTPE